MKELWKIFDALRGSFHGNEMPQMILLEAASKLSAIPEPKGWAHDRWMSFQKDPAYPQLQAAAQTLVGLDKQDRLKALDSIFERGQRGAGSTWISKEVSQQIAELALGSSSVRCSFSSSLHPCLRLALLSEERRIPLDLSFVDLTPEVCDLATLCATVLQVKLSVFLGLPFERLDGVRAETEIAFPNLGWKIQPVFELPKRTMDWMGATQSGRLTAEAVAIADQLAQAPQARSIISLSASALFRTVGVEAAAREELINSGRLQAVLDVPSGMTYHETGVQTGILLLSSEAEAHDKVRVLDLSDPHLSIRTSRGRYEANTDVSWRDIVFGAIDDCAFARDVTVPEIEEQGRILTVSRYLSRATTKLSSFNEQYGVAELSDLVDLIRPVSLPKADDGEYVIHEAAPGDIGDDGFLREPPKAVTIDRGTLRKARNQQLEPGDVILSVKGTIGRVGIVPEATPGRDEDEFWSAGQSMMILRPRRDQILPEVLYEYLSSDMMQEHLHNLASGAVIQSFNMQDLKSLPIPVPSKEEQNRIVIAFSDRLDLYVEIQRIRGQITEHRSSSWPHQDLGVL